MIFTCQRCGVVGQCRPSDRQQYCSLRCANLAKRGRTRPHPPRFITCRRPGCDGIRQVLRPNQQRRGGYCSKRCASIDHANWKHCNHSAAGKKSAQVRRRHTLELVANLTPLDAFKVGYARGLYAKWKALRKKYELVPKGTMRGTAA